MTDVTVRIFQERKSSILFFFFGKNAYKYLVQIMKVLVKLNYVHVGKEVKEIS